MSRVKFFQIVSVMLILVGAILMFERPAYAYADPGTGLLAVQAAGSALVATGWYLRKKIASLFHSGDTPGPQPVEQSVNANGEESPNQ